MTDPTALTAARNQALEVRALYEVLEQRLNGRTWSLPELMLGFSNGVGHVGRLLLAHEGTAEAFTRAMAAIRDDLSSTIARTAT